MVKRPQDTIVKTGAGEIALIDFAAGVVLQIGHQLCQELEFLSSFPGGQCRTAVEHVVVGIYSHHYKPALLAQEFLEPVWKNLVMGIDDKRLYPADGKLDWGKPAGA